MYQPPSEFTRPSVADETAAPDPEPVTIQDREPVLNVDGKTPQRDFLYYEDAVAQADILGGVVIHAGTAYSVVDA